MPIIKNLNSNLFKRFDERFLIVVQRSVFNMRSNLVLYNADDNIAAQMIKQLQIKSK